ncbi:MAG: 4Fe-4S binding protein [Planctomycetes bacterium]|nr:4Fe-4S binding protein [Planctomycetota bacterium]
MARRKIIKIDEDKCNGCGECIINCPEGALQLIDGKAKLVKESYCDGLGACLGECPTGALTIEEREADDFDEAAVQQQMAKPVELPAGCPGLQMRQMQTSLAKPLQSGEIPSQLSHWPVQLTLVPPGAAFLNNADLLLVADCVPFALPDFHQRFLQGEHPVLVCCPKLDQPGPYVEKLRKIFNSSNLKSLTIIHMEVPCCSGLCHLVKESLASSDPKFAIQEVTISIDGRVLAEIDW